MNVSSEVIIIVPIYRNNLSVFETISLDQAAKVLAGYPFVFVTSEGVDTGSHEKLVGKHQVSASKILFDSSFFASIQGYNRLLISKKFYEKFKDYKYMLILQLDVFVFRDELQRWCELDYDYIGAPWIEGYHTPEVDARYVGVGNGGFSLRKIKSCLRALTSFSYIERPKELLDGFSRNFREIPLRSVGRFIKKLTVANNTFFLFNDFVHNEDDFWGRLMTRNFDWFVVPDVNEALQFSMEVSPRKMFEDNDRRLPFGCHAWWRYDLDFWQPYIEAEGYKIGTPVIAS